MAGTGLERLVTCEGSVGVEERTWLVLVWSVLLRVRGVLVWSVCVCVCVCVYWRNGGEDMAGTGFGASCYV